MGLVATTDISLALSKEKESAPLTAITTPTWIRPPLINLELQLDQAQSKDNANKVGSGDEFPTEARLLKWVHRLTMRFEGNVEFMDYFTTRFMGTRVHAAVGTSHILSEPTFMNAKTVGRTPILFEALIDDGVEKCILQSCMIQRFSIESPEIDRLTCEAVIECLDNVDGTAETMPAAEQAVNYIYANDCAFSSLGTDLVTAAVVRSFRLIYEQELPDDIRYVIGGGYRTAGVIASGAVPKRAIFGNRKVSASFVALYDSATETAKVRNRTEGDLDVTFAGATIPSSSPTKKYQYAIHCPKVNYASANRGTAGNIQTLDIATNLLKETAAGADQNVLIKPAIQTSKAADFDFD